MRAVALSAALALLATGTARPSDPALGHAVRAHVEFLADDLLEGREAGTPGYEIAARYVAARFRALGLEPAGEAGGYLQAVPLLRNRIDEASAEVTIHRPGRRRQRLAYRDEFLMRGDSLRPETSVTAPVVFAGFGVVAPELGHDDYAGLDVDGKIVLILSGAPASFPADRRAYHSSSRQKRRDAAVRGATGLVAFPTATDERRVPWERRARNVGHPGMRWLDAEGRPNDHWPSLEGDAFLSQGAVDKLLAGSGHDLQGILEAAESGGVERFELPARLTLRRSTHHDRIVSSNVIARLPGSDPEVADQAILYTAHLDHVGRGAPLDGDAIYNGAYDNAAGVAVLLETAGLFADRSRRPRRSILFLAVTAEEKGLLGSDYFAEHPTVARERIVANINLDMPLFLHPVTELVAYGAEHSTLAHAVARAAAAHGFRLAPDPMPEEVIFVRSDQYSFVRRGIPAVFLMSGYPPAGDPAGAREVIRGFFDTHYHMPSDDTSRPFDLDAAARFTRVNHELGLEVADAPETPRWNEGDFFGETFGRRSAARR